MAKIKISELDAAAALDGTEEIPGVQGGETVKMTAQDIADLGGGGSYLVYTALLTQSGTDAPVATVLNSADANYLGDVVWTYDDVGTYTGTLAGAFTEAKTHCLISLDYNAGQPGFAIFGRATADTVGIVSFDLTPDAVDGQIFNIEIRVYP